MFKYGDKVKVKNHEDINIDIKDDFKSLSWFSESMKKCCGKVFTIEYKTIQGDFFLKECSYSYVWHEQWLELYNDKFEQHKRRLLSV